MHFGGLHVVAGEEVAESEDKNEEAVKVLRMSGKWSASGDGNKVPWKQLKLHKDDYEDDKDDNEEEEDDFDEEENEEKVSVKKSV